MGLSFWHLLLLLGIVILVFGPSRLPNLGQSLGQAIRGFKKGLQGDAEIDVTDSVKHEQISEHKQSPGSSRQQTQSQTQTQGQKSGQDT